MMMQAMSSFAAARIIIRQLADRVVWYIDLGLIPVCLMPEKSSRHPMSSIGR
jgi:hypothetical protein